MLLPDPNYFAKLCGATSLGDILLGTEVRVTGGNHAAHRALRDLLAGKPVSQSRLEVVWEAAIQNFAVQGTDLTTQKTPDLHEEQVRRDLDRFEVTLDFWQGIANAMPPRFGKLGRLIERLLSPSHSLWLIHKNEGSKTLAAKLRMVEDASVGSFFGAVATELETGKTDSAHSLEALQTFGLLAITCLFVALFEEDDPETMKGVWQLVLCEENGRVHPEQAYSKWLLRMKERSGIATNAEFLERAYGSSGVRDGKKYIAGQIVPPFKKSMQVLQALDLADNDDDWQGLQLGLIIVTLIARSSKALSAAQNRKVDLQPHQAVFDSLVTHANEWATKTS